MGNDHRQRYEWHYEVLHIQDDLPSTEVVHQIGPEHQMGSKRDNCSNIS